MPNVHDPHDTDGSQHASHHTLGDGALQAYPGNKGAAAAAQLLLASRSWNGTGRNAILNPSFEAWNDTVPSPSNPPEFPNGLPYNWGIFWKTGLQGFIRRADSDDGIPSRDAFALRWEPVDPAGSSQNIYTEAIKVVAGETITVGIWAKTQSNANPIQMSIDSYWDTIANPNPQPFASPFLAIMPVINLTTEWTLYQADVVIPATGAYISIHFRLTSVAPLLEQYCILDQSFLDRSNSGLWSAIGVADAGWDDPGINFLQNGQFSAWNFSDLGAMYLQGHPYYWDPITSTSGVAYMSRAFGPNSRTAKNAIQYTNPTPGDNTWFRQPTIYPIRNQTLRVSVWAFGLESNLGLGRDSRIAIECTSDSAIGFPSPLITTTPTARVDYNIWKKYSWDINLPVGEVFAKFAVKLTEAGGGGLGCRFTQVAVYDPYDDTGWSTDLTGFSAGANWALGSGLWRIKAGIVSLRIIYSRTTSILAVPADGNIGNLTVVNLPANFAPVFAQGLPAYANGPLMAHFVTGATVGLSALAPGGNIAIGDNLSFSGMYFLD